MAKRERHLMRLLPSFTDLNTLLSRTIIIKSHCHTRKQDNTHMTDHEQILVVAFEDEEYDDKFISFIFKIVKKFVFILKLIIIIIILN